MITFYLVGLVLFGGLVSFVLLWRNERDERRERELELKRLDQEFSKFKESFKGVLDAQAERDRILTELKSEVLNIQNKKLSIQAEMDELDSRMPALRAEFEALDEQANMQSFGFYRPRYDFADSERYQSKLEEIRDNQKEMLKDKTAATADQEWTVNGSKAEGRKQTNQYLKLMLRAFNGECDSAIAKVKYNNIQVMETRIQKAFEAINGTAEVQQCRITREFLKLKLQELYLAFEYQERVQAEKEEQRRIREQMREEELAQRELEKAMQQAEDVTCSPKTEPGVMRVLRPKVAGKDSHETEATQPGADHREAAGRGCGADGGRQRRADL